MENPPSPLEEIAQMLDPTGELRRRCQAYRKEADELLSQLQAEGKVSPKRHVGLPPEYVEELIKKHGLKDWFAQRS